MVWYVWRKCVSIRKLQHKAVSGFHSVNHNVLCECGGQMPPLLAKFSDVVLYDTLITNMNRKDGKEVSNQERLKLEENSFHLEDQDEINAFLCQCPINSCQ